MKEHDKARQWWVLIAVGLCLFLGSVDGSIVNVALPTLMQSFNADFPAVQWVVLAYLLGLTVLMVSMGRLADMIGKKRVFATGIVLFLIGSALCGLAMNIYMLIAFRFLQSVGAAMMLALGTAILTEVWPSYKRGQAIGFAAGFISLGIVIGPAIGGLMLQFLSWHWIFFVNVPIGALSFILVLLYVPPLRPSGNRESFDIAGAAALGIGLLCLTLGITLGQTDGYTAPLVLGLFVAAAGLLALFAWLEMHVRFPMLDLSLFREVQFSLNLFTGTIVFVAISGVVLLLPFYLSLVLELSLLQVGLYMAIVPLVMAVLQPMSGVLSDRLGMRSISTLGLFFILAGYLLMTTLPDSGSALSPTFGVFCLSPSACRSSIRPTTAPSWAQRPRTAWASLRPCLARCAPLARSSAWPCWEHSFTTASPSTMARLLISSRLPRRSSPPRCTTSSG